MKDHMAVNPKAATIIDRREIKPLLVKACRLMSFYEKAVGCAALVIDKTGVSIPSIDKRQSPFCEMCSNSFPKEPENWKEDEHPCMLMHKEALATSQRDDVYIYTCRAGFTYWTSPLYAGGRYAGSLAAGQVLAVSHNEVIKSFNEKAGVSRDELDRMLAAMPMKSHDEIKAMARMLQLCAKKISVNPWDHSSVMRRRLTGKTAGNIKISGNEKRENHSFNFQEKERALLAALRRGDRNTVSQILKDLMGLIEKAGQDEFDFIRFQSMELAVLLSREAGGRFKPDENYNRCMKRLKESQSVKELSENLQNAVNQLGVQIFSYQGICHALALRKAERFIWENYSKKISLEEIAAVSGLSAPYFSTIFKKELGLNLCDYLNRLRIDKAAAMLTETDTSLAEIAAVCGYEDQSWFSKVFKNRMGISPGKFREQGK